MAGKKVNRLIKGEKYIYEYSVKFIKESTRVVFGMLLKTINGIELGGFTTSHPQEENKLNIYQNEQYMVKFNFRCSLNPGIFYECWSFRNDRK